MKEYKPLLKTDMYNTDSGMNLDQRMSMELIPETQQEFLLETELLDNLENNKYSESPYDRFGSFERFQEEKILQGQLRKTTILISTGTPVAGKSHHLNQWQMELITRLAGQQPSGDVKLQIEGEPIRPYTFTWADLVDISRKLGVVRPELQFGEWSEEEVATISRVGKKAIDIAREGVNGIEGIEGNALGIIGIDVPMTTASIIKEDDQDKVIGYDRFLSVVQDLVHDPETEQTTFLTALIPDAESQHRRLTEREMLHNASLDEYKEWAEKTRTKVKKESMDQIIRHTLTRSATVSAATQIAKHMSELLINLSHRGEVQLNNTEIGVLTQEVDLIENGHVLTSNPVRQLQDDKLIIVARKLHPHIFQGLGINPSNYFDAWNKDLEQVNLYPQLSKKHNLINQIIDVNPKLLLP